MANQPAMDDELLTRYLLGSLPEEETERLDELSVADDEIAWRLQAVENDLVDRYVRGDMKGDTLDRFRSAYLASPARRKKIAFAKALDSVEHRGKGSGISPWWAVAAAAVIAIAVMTSLLFIPRHEQRMAPPEVIARVAKPQPAPAPRPIAPVMTATFLLPPPARGAGSIETLDVPAAAQRVVIRLQLESDDFPEYRAVLRDLATSEIVWRSEPVRSAPEGKWRSVAIEIPRPTLSQQHYGLELSGLPRGGPAELIGTYPFRVLAK